jgi:hypothetical protein
LSKKLVNLIGAAVTVAILVLGVVAVALPLVASAGATWSSADDVAAQNRTQQTLLDTLTAQSKDMTELDATVATLRAEITPAAYLEDAIQLAVEAAAAHDATVTSVTGGPVEPFAPRLTVGGGETPPAALEETPAPATDPPAETPAPEGPAIPQDSAAPETTPAAGPLQIEVTLLIEADDVAAATRVLDDLRAGPRLVAVTQAGVTSDETGAKLSVTLLLFVSP